MGWFDFLMAPLNAINPFYQERQRGPFTSNEFIQSNQALQEYYKKTFNKDRPEGFLDFEKWRNAGLNPWQAPQVALHANPWRNGRLGQIASNGGIPNVINGNFGIPNFDAFSMPGASFGGPQSEFNQLIGMTDMVGHAYNQGAFG
ncbi:MAG: hypothetical protein VKJ06_04860 [Vampirovibrionales bacterium]|nr:hypothetical protein [Vampirovibrionales bacterium]